MLKVVVFDGGYGGELFADQLEEELPVLEVIRVIDWRNAEQILASPRKARRVAVDALRPYIGNVDLIIIANNLITVTSLKYLRRKYRNQKFLGLSLKTPDTYVKRDVVILATKAITKTISYQNYIFRLKRRAKTVVLDEWPNQIDDGELTEAEIHKTLSPYITRINPNREEVVLACTQFNDIIPELRRLFGKNLKIHDSFSDAIRNTCHTLQIRGGTGKKK